MKTIRISKQAKTVNALLKKARQEGVILRAPDGNEFILAEIDDFNREIELTRENKRLMKLLDSRPNRQPLFPWEKQRGVLVSNSCPTPRCSRQAAREVDQKSQWFARAACG